MKKKILIMYARYGSGHKTIAEYVANYIKENNKEFEIMLFDMTEYANILGKFSVKVMDFVSKMRPEAIFDACYEAADHKLSSIGHNLFTKKSYDNKKLREIISDFNPDIVISSHFYCSNIITYYNDIKLINAKLFTIITDYTTHEFWTKNHKKETGFIVANEIVKKKLVDRGVDKKKIYPFGLPLNLEQIKHLDNKKDILKRYNLSGKRKIFLFFGGSTAGSMYYYDYFKILTKMDLDIDIIFVCGKNEKLKNKCQKLVEEKGIKNISVMGFTTDVFNLLKISDLVISKPGGATVTECLEMRVPMLLVPGIGGQEKYNARFMAKKKFGISVRNKKAFKRAINSLVRNGLVIDKMTERLCKLDKNNSVKKINDLIKKELV